MGQEGDEGNLVIQDNVNRNMWVTYIHNIPLQGYINDIAYPSQIHD